MAANAMGNLTLVIHKAVNLPNTALKGKQDPYLKIRLDSQDSKEASKGEVKKDAGTEPVFEERFNFQLKGFEKSVCLEIWDESVLKDDKIAYAIIPIEDLISFGQSSRWVSLSKRGKDESNKEGGAVELSCTFNGQIQRQQQMGQGVGMGQQQMGQQQMGQQQMGQGYGYSQQMGSGYGQQMGQGYGYGQQMGSGYGQQMGYQMGQGKDQIGYQGQFQGQQGQIQGQQPAQFPQQNPHQHHHHGFGSK